MVRLCDTWLLSVGGSEVAKWWDRSSVLPLSLVTEGSSIWCTTPPTFHHLTGKIKIRRERWDLKAQDYDGYSIIKGTFVKYTCTVESIDGLKLRPFSSGASPTQQRVYRQASSFGLGSTRFLLQHSRGLFSSISRSTLAGNPICRLNGSTIHSVALESRNHRCRLISPRKSIYGLE